jgi:hypothetical protein
MKLTAKTDLDVPAAQVYAILADFPAWEREAARHGIVIERPPGAPMMGVGAEWKIQGMYRGKTRRLSIRMEKMIQDQRLQASVTSAPADGAGELEVIVLSPRRSRLKVEVEMKPKTLAARLFFNTLRLAKGRVQLRFDARLAALNARIKDTYDRGVKTT